jgi:uncharacterized membrane protein YdbT with pleckstrin-like domain
LPGGARTTEEVGELAFPKRLSNGEKQVLALRPHWLGVVFPLLVTVGLLIAMGVAMVSIPEDWPAVIRWAVFAVFGLIMVLWPFRRLVAWVTSEYLITTERVIHRMGWFTRRQVEIPIGGIADVIFSQTLIQRLAGIGDVVIESAGGSGFTRLDSIAHADDVHRVVCAHQERARAAGHSPTPRAVGPLEKIERLAQLMERGLLSREEFQVQKHRLLKQL